MSSQVAENCNRNEIGEPVGVSGCGNSRRGM